MKSQSIRPLGVFESESNEATLGSKGFEKQSLGDGAFVYVKKEETMPALDIHRYAKPATPWTKPATAA